MKTLACVVALLALLLLPGCDGDKYTGDIIRPEEIPGSFDGEFFLDPSVQGTVEKVVVSVYASCGDFLSRQPMAVTQTDVNGRYFIHNVPPGHYILVALKDNDADGRVSPGDFYLEHNNCCGCEVCCITDGSTGNFSGKLEVVQ